MYMEPEMRLAITIVDSLLKEQSHYVRENWRVISNSSVFDIIGHNTYNARIYDRI